RAPCVCATRAALASVHPLRVGAASLPAGRLDDHSARPRQLSDGGRHSNRRTTMRTTAIAAAVTLCVGAPSVFANGGGFEDYARVREVTPEYQSVNVPRQECYSEVVPQQRYSRGGDSIAGPLIGGVAGGLLGSRFGQG